MKYKNLMGDQHFNWKGDLAKHAAIHTWLINHYGKANCCQNKRCEGFSKTYEWALQKGKLYSHNISNYIKLCKSCHRKYDMTDEIRKKISKANIGRSISEQHKNILRERMKLHNPSFGGLSKEHKMKISKNNARNMLNKHLSQDQKNHLSKIYKGKTWEEIYGKEKAKRMRINLVKNNWRNKK